MKSVKMSQIRCEKQWNSGRGRGIKREKSGGLPQATMGGTNQRGGTEIKLQKKIIKILLFVWRGS